MQDMQQPISEGRLPTHSDACRFQVQEQFTLTRDFKHATAHLQQMSPSILSLLNDSVGNDSKLNRRKQEQKLTMAGSM